MPFIQLTWQNEALIAFSVMSLLIFHQFKQVGCHKFQIRARIYELYLKKKSIHLKNEYFLVLSWKKFGRWSKHNWNRLQKIMFAEIILLFGKKLKFVKCSKQNWNKPPKINVRWNYFSNNNLGKTKIPVEHTRRFQ